ncbi:hypothetical protein [aff. Roholtiella sp. LEGE 12411]|nr:hypothetical protein [aff. Roholtiella sp. LEGE 12411]
MDLVIGHWAWGMGHGALGIGHWALGMGHWFSAKDKGQMTND